MKSVTWSIVVASTRCSVGDAVQVALHHTDHSLYHTVLVYQRARG